jgi:hypothetical protein
MAVDPNVAKQLDSQFANLNSAAKQSLQTAIPITFQLIQTCGVNGSFPTFSANFDILRFT